MALIAFIIAAIVVVGGISLALLYIAFWFLVIFWAIAIGICFAILTLALGPDNMPLAALLAIPLGIGIVTLIDHHHKPAETEHH